jgi:hypothetical protein
LLTVKKGKVKTRRNDRSEVLLDVSERARLVSRKTRGNEKVHRNTRRALNLPTLAGRLTILVLVWTEARLPQALRERGVPLLIEHSERESHIEVEGTDVTVISGSDLSLVNEE